MLSLKIFIYNMFNMLTEACSVYQSTIQHIIVLSLKHFHVQVQYVFKTFKNGLDYNVFFLN